MKLEGIRAAFLGDSITEGVGVPSEEFAYWRVLGRKFGLGRVSADGIGGTRIARQQTPTPEPNSKWDAFFASRVENLDPDADLVVVFGGTNDFGHGDAPIGKETDRTPDSFFGAVHDLCGKLLRRYPGAKIVFMTPLPRAEEERNGKTLAEYAEAIKTVCGGVGIPVFDLYRKSGICPAKEEDRIRFVPDGLHPNEAGAERIADLFGEYLLSL